MVGGVFNQMLTVIIFFANYRRSIPRFVGKKDILSRTCVVLFDDAFNKCSVFCFGYHNFATISMLQILLFAMKT